MTPTGPTGRQAMSLDDARLEQSPTFLGEIWQFVCATGKWWLVPVLVALLLLGFVVLASGAWYAPFLYSLF